MRTTLISVGLTLLLANIPACASPVFEVRADVGLVGHEVEPMEFPLGLSLAVWEEHLVRDRIAFRLGLGYRVQWSEEGRGLIAPDCCSGPERGTYDEEPLIFYGIQTGVRLVGHREAATPFGELIVGAGRSGREDPQADAFLSVGAGYSWPLASRAELTLTMIERMHRESELSAVSLALGISYGAR